MHAFAVEVSRMVSGTRQTHYYGAPAFTTGPDDTPAHTTFRALIKGIGGKGREMFSGARVVGPVKASETKLELSNQGKDFDTWIGTGWSGGKVVVRWGEIGAPYPSAWTVVNTAYVKSLPIDFDVATFALRDRLYLLEKNVVTKLFDGSGGLEGNGVAQKKFQLAIGQPGYIPLIPLDIVQGRYAVNAGASDARTMSGQEPPIGYVFDGGVRLTHEGFYESEDDYLNGAAPSPGAFKVFAKGWDTTGNFAGNSPGPLYVRVGSPVVVELRFYPAGRLMNEGDLFTSLRDWTVCDLLNRAGIPVTPSTMAPGSVNHSLGNRLLDGDETYLDVLSDVALYTHTAFGFTRLDEFFAFELRDPEDSSRPADVVQFQFNAGNSKSFRRIAIPGMEAPVHQVNVSFGETWPCQVSNSEEPEDQAAKEAVQRSPWQGTFSGTNEQVLADNPGALSVDVEIIGNEFTTRSVKQGWINRYIELHGGQRDFFEVECEAFSSIDENAVAKTEALLAIELGQKVEVLHARFGCTPARKFRVIRISPNLSGPKPTITFGLWGGAAGPATSVLGGGSGSAGGSGATETVSGLLGFIGLGARGKATLSSARAALAALVGFARFGARGKATLEVPPISQVGSPSIDQITGGSDKSVPAHAAGDFIIAVHRNVGSSTPPAAITGGAFSTIATHTPSFGNGVRIQVLLDAAGTVSNVQSASTGLWEIVVLRGVVGVGDVEVDDTSAQPGTTVTVPGLSLQNGDGTSVVIVVVTNNQGATSPSDPSGMTELLDNVPAGFGGGALSLWISAAAVSSYAGGTSTGDNGFQAAFAIELKNHT